MSSDLPLAADGPPASVSTAKGTPLAALPRGYRWRLLALLTLVYASHSMDRSVTSIVLELIKREFHLSDGQAGILGGLAHGIAFCIFVIPVGWIADRGNRRNILACLLALWSGITLLGAFARSYAALVLVRFGVGAAESGGAPVAMSMLGDVFTPRERPMAVGFLYVGLAIGQGLIFFVGGYIAQWAGWRWVYAIAGIPGIIIAIALFAFARETVRGERDETPHESGRSASPLAVFSYMLRHPSLMLIAFGASCCSMASNITWVWMASVMIRSHHMTIGTVGMVLAIAGGIGSGVGSLASGPISSWIARNGINRLGYVAGAVALLGTPLGMGAIFSPETSVAVACILGLGVMLGAWLPPAFGLALGLAPSQMRASVMSVIQLGSNFFALAVGPVLVGLLSDHIGGDRSLLYAMGLVFSVMFIAAISFFIAGFKARGIVADAPAGGIAAH